MNAQLRDAATRILKDIDKVVSNMTFEREEVIEFLQEISGHCDITEDAMAEDAKREARGG